MRISRRGFIGACIAAMAAPTAAITSTTPTTPLIISDSVSLNNRKLKAVWSYEAQQDLKAVHNLEAEAELLELLTKQINECLTKEIDKEILNDLRLFQSRPNGNGNYRSRNATSVWKQVA